MTNLSNFSNEIWKDISGYEGYYQASNLGRVRSIDRYVNGWNGLKLKKGKVLSQRLGNTGYMTCVLCKRQHERNQFVHRLVLMAFCGAPKNNKIVGMHLNDNKTDNRIDNLKWGTQKDNQWDCQIKNRKNVINKRKVVAKNILTGETVVYESIAKACSKLGVCSSNINKVLRGERDRTLHYSFKYYQNEI